MLNWFSDLTMGPWYTDLGALAVGLTAAGVVWKMVAWPILRSMWLTINAVPRIPTLLEEIQNILQAGVLAKLEAVQAEQARVKEQLAAAIPPIEKVKVDVANHELRLSDHELRIHAMEQRVSK